MENLLERNSVSQRNNLFSLKKALDKTTRWTQSRKSLWQCNWSCDQGKWRCGFRTVGPGASWSRQRWSASTSRGGSVPSQSRTGGSRGKWRSCEPLRWAHPPWSPLTPANRSRPPHFPCVPAASVSPPPPTNRPPPRPLCPLKCRQLNPANPPRPVDPITIVHRLLCTPPLLPHHLINQKQGTNLTKLYKTKKLVWMKI